MAFLLFRWPRVLDVRGHFWLFPLAPHPPCPLLPFPEAVMGAREARTLEEGVVSPGDLDLVMSDGLGLRYAFIGPLETMHLNAEGMLSYCDRYSEGMKRVLKTFGPIPEFSGATAEKVHQAMCVKVPDDAEHLAARRAWRDGCLMRLAQLKRQLPQ